MADYVGTFETKEEALKWLDTNDLNEDVCKVIRVKAKAEYLD
ncbi:hypothetical protein [Cyanobacterium sp. HL-69]